MTSFFSNSQTFENHDKNPVFKFMRILDLINLEFSLKFWRE